jgi:hypothetical protein
MTFQGIQPAEGGIESIKRLIRQLANPPEWMPGRGRVLDRDVGEQGSLRSCLPRINEWATAEFWKKLGFLANS